VHEELTLYFVVSRDSQKSANIKHDPRISIGALRWEFAVHDMEVRATDAARAHPQTQLAWSWVWILATHRRQELARCLETHAEHDVHRRRDRRTRQPDVRRLMLSLALEGPVFRGAWV